MSKSSPTLNPFTLAAIGIVVLAIAAIAITQSIVSDGDSDQDVADKKTSSQPAKSARRTSDPKREGYVNSTKKSDGKTEEEKDGGIEFGVVPPKEKRAQYMAAVATRARTELTEIRAEARKKFESITDEEKLRLLQAENRAEAEKAFPGRAREKRLLSLLRVQNIWQMNHHLSKKPNFAREAAAFDDRLAEWVVDSENMNDTDFHTSYKALVQDLTALRKRSVAASPGNPTTPGSPQ